MPGDNIKMTVELIAPIAMDEGLRFAIREGVELSVPASSPRLSSNLKASIIGASTPVAGALAQLSL